MRPLHMALALLMMGAGAVSAAAEPDMPGYMQDVQFSSEGGRGRANLRIYADCIVARHSKAALNWLALPLNKEAEQAPDFVTRTSACYPGIALQMSLHHLRGALFEAFYLTGASLDGAKQPTPAGEYGPNDARALAACVAAKDPREIDSYIRERPATKGEKDKLAQLMPTIRSCALALHQQLPNVSTFRAAVGEVLYFAQFSSERTALKEVGQ